MADADGDDRRRRRGFDVFASQLRHFDGKLAEFRSLYDSFLAEEKAGFRVWLERVAALAKEGHQWCARLHVRTENEECDAEGNTLRWEAADFSPQTMLAAIQAWDKGDEFTPTSVMP